MAPAEAKNHLIDTTEANPLNATVEAAEKLLEAAKRRQALYQWLRGLTDEAGLHDVSPSTAEEIARYYHRTLGRKSGFSPEECEHVNGELARIEELTMAAYPHFRA